MKSTLSQNTAGIGVIAVGTLLLLDTLGVTNGALGTWWPLFIVAVGVVMLINNLKDYIWGVGFIGVGILFQLYTLNVLEVNPWKFFWPVVIILVGISLVANRRNAPKDSKEDSDDATAFFSGIDQVNVSKDYKGGEVSAVFGGVKIDMRKAVIKEQATLNVFVLCGGVELIVPEGVIVKTKAACIMGGIDSKRATLAADGAPILYITGTVVMGGVEVKI